MIAIINIDPVQRKTGTHLYQIRINRKIISQFIKFKKNILILIFDLIAINGSLLFATQFRFGGFFNFPEYAYPIVFIVLSLILVTTMTAVGEYFDKVFLY